MLQEPSENQERRAFLGPKCIHLVAAVRYLTAAVHEHSCFLHDALAENPKPRPGLLGIYRLSSNTCSQRPLSSHAFCRPGHVLPCCAPTPRLLPRKLREITARLKVNLTKIKKITQAEGRARESDSSSGRRAASAGGKEGKEGKGAGDGGAEEGGSWRDAGGILGEMKEGINVNLKDVKVPEFDVRLR